MSISASRGKSNRNTNSINKHNSCKFVIPIYQEHKFHSIHHCTPFTSIGFTKDRTFEAHNLNPFENKTIKTVSGNLYDEFVSSPAG